jgi:hypothetical protein
MQALGKRTQIEDLQSHQPTNLQKQAPYAKNENRKKIESHKQMSKHEHWM